jgi:glutaredoxin
VFWKVFRATRLLTYSLLFIFVLFTFAANPAEALTLLYSGEEHGQLGLHGCGTEQVGGLAHRQTLITDLRIRHGTVLNLHTGNLIDPTDPNAEWVYQIGLSALDAMKVDVLCLGPNELSLPLETLAAFHADYPEVGVVCANVATGIETRYVMRSVASTNVAVVSLISENYAPELLIPPQNALAELEAELVNQSTVIVVVFHGTQEEAHTLSEAVPWIDILIVAANQQKDIAKAHKPSILAGKTATVINATQGGAIGALGIERDAERQRYIFTSEHHGVSEKIAPDAALEQLLEAYQALTATEPTFQTNAFDVPNNAIHIAYFHKHGCQKCARAVKTLKTLQARYPNIVVEQQDAKREQALLEAMDILYEVPETKRLTTPAVFIGDTALIGELDEQRLETTVQKYLAIGVASRLKDAEAHLDTAESEIVNRFHGFGTLAVAGAGFLDGINPCAFATIVFFISYMNLVGRGRKEMLIAGGAFALAVFVTYLLVGLGTLSFMNYLNRFSGVAKCVYLIAATTTFVLAGLSLYDAVKAKQGKTKDILLQLPRALKLRIHKVIRERTRTSGVIAGALVIGFVISALELVCTGQVYLPTLTFVAGIESMRVDAIAYLLLYNVMFIVPLLVVFGCVYWGTTSMQLGGILQKHLVTVKVGIGLLLFGLGIWLVLSVIA